jgi:hypothetical protein
MFPGGMKNAMQQMRKIQELMEKKQAELGNLRIEATAGGGMVKVVANGREEIVDIEIAKEVVNPEDIGMLEDLILAAIKEAQTKSKDVAQKQMAEVMGSLGLPKIPGLF